MPTFYIGSPAKKKNVAAVSVTGAVIAEIPASVYGAGSTVTATDANLVAGNVKKDVAIFGINGTYEGAFTGVTGDASVTVAKNGNAIEAVVPAGGWNGTYKLIDAGAATNVISENIKDGVNILGVTGSMTGSTGGFTGVTGDVASTVSLSGSDLVAVVPAGGYDGTYKLIDAGAGSSITGTNIKSGVNILGVTGTLSTSAGILSTGNYVSRTVGDDGYTQSGVSLSGRFVDNGDNTVTDNYCNVVWIKDPSKVIPNGIGGLGENLGYWRDTRGTITQGQRCDINFPAWYDDVGYSYVVGDIRSYSGTLYRCITGNNASNHRPGTASDRLTYWTQYPEWTTNMSFEVYSYHSYNGVLYRCIVAHLSSTYEPVYGYYYELKWQVIPNWSAGTYANNALVNYYGTLYKSNCDNNTEEPSTGTQWDISYDYSMWTENETWSLNEICTYYDGNFYKCISAHTSTAIDTSNASYWEEITTTEWAIDTTYYANDKVFDSYTAYGCKVQHLSSNFEPTVAPLWASYWEVDSNAVYESDGVYVALQTHTAAYDKYPAVGSSYWVKYSLSSIWSWMNATHPTPTTGWRYTTETDGIATIVNNLSYNGYSDWEMPTVNELMSLQNWQSDYVDIRTYPEFVTLMPNSTLRYWTSTGTMEYGWDDSLIVDFTGRAAPMNTKFSRWIANNSTAIRPCRRLSSSTPAFVASNIAQTATLTVTGFGANTSNMNDGLKSAYCQSNATTAAVQFTISEATKINIGKVYYLPVTTVPTLTWYYYSAGNWVEIGNIMISSTASDIDSHRQQYNRWSPITAQDFKLVITGIPAGQSVRVYEIELFTAV